MFVVLAGNFIGREYPKFNRIVYINYATLFDQ